MLLIVQDRQLTADVVEWTTRTVAAGVRSKERGVVLVEHLGDEALRTAAGQVVALRSDTEYDRLLATTAGAAACSWHGRPAASEGSHGPTQGSAQTSNEGHTVGPGHPPCSKRPGQNPCSNGRPLR